MSKTDRQTVRQTHKQCVHVSLPITEQSRTQGKDKDTNCREVNAVTLKVEVKDNDTSDQAKVTAVTLKVKARPMI